MLSSTAKLRAQLQQNAIVTLPGIYDCVSAQAAARAKFQTLFVSGYAVSASALGLPDYGFLTATEMLAAVTRITAAVDLPVIADIDTGYGNPLNVYRTIEDIVRCGAAGVFLEDQLWPKRCGHMSGKKLIPMSEHAEKIRAAVEARGDSGLVIVARTDARAVEGFDAALKRAEAYRAAGADVLFIEAPENLEELKEIPKAFPGTPCLANMIEHGKTPYLTAAELEDIGFRMVVYPLSGLYAAAQAMTTVYQALAAQGSTKDIAQPMFDFADFAEFIDLGKFQAREKKFSC